MKAPDDHYNFDKETPDGRPIKIFDLDEKPPKKKPSQLEDPYAWAGFIIGLIFLYILVFHFIDIVRVVFIFVAPFAMVFIIANWIFRR